MVKDTGTIKISLAAARVNANLTQTEVAKEMGISNSTVVSWEKGKTEPSISQADRLSELYKIKKDNIFFGHTLTLSEKKKEV